LELQIELHSNHRKSFIPKIYQIASFGSLFAFFSANFRSASAFDLFSSSPNYPPSRTAFSLSPPSTTSAAAGPSSPKVLKSALKVGGLSNFTPAAMPAHIDEESGE
jgi:hypothetical protein